MPQVPMRDIAVAFEVGDQTVVVDLIAEKDAHRDVGIPWDRISPPRRRRARRPGPCWMGISYRCDTGRIYALPFLSTRPGRAPVCFPSSITGSPATNT